MKTFTDLRGQSRPSGDLPLFDAPATVRTFDSPEFRDISFYEVEAKSILNRVPAPNLPFEWTINVYRGCSHACSYCGYGETPILMADGRTKPLADIRAGDTIYGTIFDGKYRRYVATQVLDHWSTVKPAYRVTLEDGTKLITSGDHRFLSNRGWKYVTDSVPGHQQRAHLTTNNELLGTGQFAVPPKDGPDYRRGYLCGMIRGDGHVSLSTYPGLNQLGSKVSQFRLALVDIEALQRTRDYLAYLGLNLKEFVFQEATEARKQVYAIRTGVRRSVAAIVETIAWPNAPSTEWCKGFLAGIFDAEGSYSRGILRICNTDQTIIDQVTAGLRRFGFSYRVETRSTAFMRWPWPPRGARSGRAPPPR